MAAAGCGGGDRPAITLSTRPRRPVAGGASCSAKVTVAPMDPEAQQHPSVPEYERAGAWEPAEGVDATGRSTASRSPLVVSPKRNLPGAPFGLDSSTDAAYSADGAKGQWHRFAFCAVVTFVVVVIIGGVVVTTSVAADADARDLELARLEGEGAAQQLASTVERVLRNQIADLRLLASTIGKRDDGLLDRWDHVASEFYTVFEGILGVGAMRELPGNQREEWEALMSQHYGMNVSVLNPDGSVAEARDVYYVMQHTMPRAPVLDFKDLLVADGRKELISAALSQNDVRVSDVILLIRGGINGYLASVKVNQTDGSSEAWGMLSCSLRVDTLVERSLASATRAPDSHAGGLSVSLWDDTNTSSLVYHSTDATDREFCVGSFTFNFAQRSLRLEVYSTEEFLRLHTSAKSPAVIIAGSVVTAVLVLFVITTAAIIRYMSSNATAQAVAAAEMAHTRVLSYVLHELRNPLHAISGFLSLADELVKLGGEQAKRSLQESLTSAASQTYHMQAVLDDVLDIRALKEGDFTVVPRLTSVASILRDTGFQFSSLVGDGVRLITSVDESVPKWSKVDPTRIRQVVANALHNAYKATSCGSIVLGGSVVGSASNGQLWVAITIINSNPAGLPGNISRWAERQRSAAHAALPSTVITSVDLWLQQLMRSSDPEGLNVFSPPSSKAVSSDVARHVRGVKSTNIGLELCSRIAAQLGGSIMMDHDAPLQLTRFVLVIPTTVASHPTSSLVSPTHSKGDGVTSHTPEAPSADHDGNAPRVLFVDDEHVMRVLGKRMCRRAGAVVTVCEDGADVAQALEADRTIDIVLMDIVMHRSDGRSVCSELRAAGVALPIYAVTANVGPAHLAEYKACGFNGLLGKPYNASDVARLLRHARSNPDEWWMNEDPAIV